MALKLAQYNLLKQEIAYITMKKLMNEKVINEEVIDQTIEAAKEDIDDVLLKIGTDAANRLENAESAFNTEQAQEYAPFGVYEGPAFGGPGLKAGSRIAKSKLDNTISKEESIKKLAIGWVTKKLEKVSRKSKKSYLTNE